MMDQNLISDPRNKDRAIGLVRISETSKTQEIFSPNRRDPEHIYEFPFLAFASHLHIASDR
jgi:hypothetical protein